MQVKVHNDNEYPYVEKFGGNTIRIPPKSFIEMDSNEASQFLGTNPGTAEVDANGIQKPQTYKMLRVERILTAKPDPVRKEFKCMMDGATFPSQELLDAYILEFHSDKMIDQEAKAKLQKKRGRPAKGALSDSSSDRDGSEAKV
jgi:hypothetical protein